MRFEVEKLPPFSKKRVLFSIGLIPVFILGYMIVAGVFKKEEGFQTIISEAFYQFLTFGVFAWGPAFIFYPFIEQFAIRKEISSFYLIKVLALEVLICCLPMVYRLSVLPTVKSSLWIIEVVFISQILRAIIILRPWKVLKIKLI